MTCTQLTDIFVSSPFFWNKHNNPCARRGILKTVPKNYISVNIKIT